MEYKLILLVYEIPATDCLLNCFPLLQAHGVLL